MRGDVALRLRLLLRPSALAGLVAAGAGGAALVAAYLPWYQVAAHVEMHGEAQSRWVASLAGWQAQPWGWVVPLLALVAIVMGLAVALDRPPRLARDLQLLSGLGMGAAVAAGALLFPPVARFDVAGSRLRELAELAGRLPDDVAMSFSVRPGAGLWVTLLAAVVLVVAALAGRGRL